MLEIKDLKVNYGGIEALKGISFHVEEGEIVTLIGANGAGKSTTLRSIMEVVKPASGTITFQGEDITGMNTQKIVDRGIVLVPEGRRVFPNLTVLETCGSAPICARIKQASTRTCTMYTASSPGWRSGIGSWQAPYPAASSRCWL